MSQSVPTHEQVGYVFDEWRTSVGRERQERYHQGAEIDDSLYRDFADPSILANDCLHGARPKDDLGATRLHYGARLRQAAPIRSDQELLVRAEVASVAPVRRGRLITIAFAFVDTDGGVPVRIDHQSLIVDADDAKAGAAGQGKSTAPDDRAFVSLARKQMTPRGVRQFSHEFPHLRSHHEPEAAAAIGMRAPIAQGLMSLTNMLEQLSLEGPPRAVDIAVRFLRPIFWDEEIDIQGHRQGGRLSALRCLKPDGKVASTGTIEQLVY
ncbi:MAG: MaoC/PaaZ C-terminal domain-containing protein [Alphaproteobacteria bacterium]|jgi:hypothetical protein|nr:MaoC/PaaZ C-terminal domain-containing protein [Alphaproteobacteria bacterium]MDP6566320.1 MaoC/PaaZ C-terminal domain-containing protein [Alphaproteobacteria bacterium]MDP6812697.1 MaoC/PaaZ C-terminal domain-containing protein [Alphaproteobacteria bacterium]